ncbi:MAG: hypothetical protein GY906_28925 [bacterium]|nr:hypothetical protein [bacterium]
MTDTNFKTRSIRTAKWDVMPVVRGKVVEKGEHVDDKRPAPFIVVDTGVSLVRVYQSKDLDELFSVVEVGDSASIEFLEMVALEKGRRFRSFDASCWTGDDPAAV